MGGNIAMAFTIMVTRATLYLSLLSMSIWEFNHF